MDEEVWQDVPNYEGYYQISNCGNLRRLWRSYLKADGAWGCEWTRAVKPQMSQRGYVVVNLQREGDRKRHHIHKLVAEAFVPNPRNELAVRHLDGDAENNKSDNLEWFESNNKPKLSHTERVEIIDAVTTTDASVNELAEHYQISRDAIRYLLKYYKY